MIHKTIPHPIEAIIFDMDGTLVNTEPVHCAAWLETLAARGFHYDEHWFEQWVGTADRFLAQGVIDEHQLSVPARVLQQEKETRFHQIVTTANWIFPGLAPILSELQTLLPLAIATNSAYMDAQHVFQSSPIDSYMQTIVTADDVERLKPHPDMYLLAAERLGVRAEHCLVIEDSPAGSQGAYAAGTYVLGLTSSQPREKMTAVHEWFDTPLAAMKRVRELVS